MGGKSHVITFRVFPFKKGTLYCTVNTIPDAIYGEHYRVIPSRKGHQPKPVFGYKKNLFFLGNITIFSKVNRKVSAYFLVGIQN